MSANYWKKLGVHFPFLYCLLTFWGTGCTKLVEVPNPTSSVTANQVFSSDATATAAMLGIYSQMSSQQTFSSVYTTWFLGISADELKDELSGYEQNDIFLINNLSAELASSTILGIFWQPAYYDIYSANAIIAGVEASTGISLATRNQLIGEAKFIRAFCYFYLTNICGNVPLALTMDFNQTALFAGSSQSQVYKQIISDLVDAQNLMVSDFSLSNGMPIRANKWAATALLARAYQYCGEWQSADSAANAVISSGNFKLVSNLDSVFLANSAEAILQLQSTNGSNYATWEAQSILPYSGGEAPGLWLTPQLLNAFENGDLRRLDWVDSTVDYSGNIYYYPIKYQSLGGSPNDIQENYMLLRFAEQYLIRAEAEANLNQLGNAINDINSIRTRAGLAGIPSTLSQLQVLSAIQQEYFVEFFAEWGHRWLDLKRWSISISTLRNIVYKAPYIDSTQLLYPIPMSEIQVDPNLTQNSGY